MKKEIEIKLRIDEKKFNELVNDKKNFQFERTLGFFMKDEENTKKGIFPRIKDVTKNGERKAYITVKVKKLDEVSKMFKRDEYEFILNNSSDEIINEIAGVFKALEYPIVEIFDKRRYFLPKMNNCDVIVDELPFGYFVEIEGEEDEIEKSISELELMDYERNTQAYLGIWEDFKRANNMPMTEECVFK